MIKFLILILSFSVVQCEDSLANALTSCQLAYCSRDSLQYHGVVVFNDENDRFQAIYQEINKTGYLAFRGTIDVYNWLTDLDAFKVKLHDEDQSVLVHKGFKYASDSLKEQIFAFLITKNITDIYVVGHSLGGSIAQLISEYIYTMSKNQIQVRVITFGSPRVGNYQFQQYFDSILQHKRFVHNRDFIPHVPTLLQGFIHTGQEYWIDSLDNIHYCGVDSLPAFKENRCSSDVIPIPSVEEHRHYLLEISQCPLSQLFLI